jgi:hypothetical protein
MGLSASEIAGKLLEQALDDVLSGSDAIPAVGAALIVLRIEAGEHPADELPRLEAFATGETLAECICPPDQVARGGWSSRCRATH